MSGLILPRGAGGERAPAFEAHRQRPFFVRENLGPWGGRVTVTRVTARHASALLQAIRHEVTATWVGPPMVGTGYPADEIASRSDAWWTDDGQLAEAVARRACDELCQARVPNLPQLAELARRRA